MAFDRRTFWCAAKLSLIPLGVAAICVSTPAQGPTPETGNTLFPGGAYVAYSSGFTSRQSPDPATPAAALRPTFQHEARFLFNWGVRRDLEVSALLPVETLDFHFLGAGAVSNGGTGLGDAMIVVKYRFLRRDSARGTTQASVSLGPKLPTGSTGLRDSAGQRLATGLQPGSGSTDLLFGLNGTYTGLFHLEKLVLDGAFQYVKRTEGAQSVRFGDSFETRAWLSYRPIQSKSLSHEWWIGPSLTWRHFAPDAQTGIEVPGSNGNELLFGAATYISPHAGLMFWIGGDFPVYSTKNRTFCQTDHRIMVGITKQFRLAL